MHRGSHFNMVVPVTSEVAGSSPKPASLNSGLQTYSDSSVRKKLSFVRILLFYTCVMICVCSVSIASLGCRRKVSHICEIGFVCLNCKQCAFAVLFSLTQTPWLLSAVAEDHSCVCSQNISTQ